MKITQIRLGHDYPIKKKKDKMVFKIFIVVFAIIVSIFLLKGFDEYVREIISVKNQNQQNLLTWISSLSSFWGGIFGGILSGILSFLGILITIRYYRNTDIENKISDSKPFANIMIKDVIDSSEKERIEEHFLADIGVGENEINVMIEIENIGKEFLRTVAYYNGTNFGGYQFNHIIKARDALSIPFILKIKYQGYDDNIKFSLRYFDCFMNEYMQTFEIRLDKNHSKINFEPQYPKIIETVFK